MPATPAVHHACPILSQDGLTKSEAETKKDIKDVSLLIQEAQDYIESRKADLEKAANAWRKAAPTVQAKEDRHVELERVEGEKLSELVALLSGGIKTGYEDVTSKTSTVMRMTQEHTVFEQELQALVTKMTNLTERRLEAEQALAVANGSYVAELNEYEGKLVAFKAHKEIKREQHADYMSEYKALNELHGAVTASDREVEKAELEKQKLVTISKGKIAAHETKKRMTVDLNLQKAKGEGQEKTIEELTKEAKMRKAKEEKDEREKAELKAAKEKDEREKAQLKADNEQLLADNEALAKTSKKEKAKLEKMQAESTKDAAGLYKMMQESVRVQQQLIAAYQKGGKM